MEKLLNKEIDDTVAEYILKKVDEHRKQVEESYSQKLIAEREKAFTFADAKIAEAKKELREEYSVKVLSAVEEKEQEIAELKETLAERVNTFLSNSKEEVRSLVEEEMRLDSNELKAQHLLEQIRELVGQGSPIIASVEESEAAQLKQDIIALKERVEKDKKVKETLKAQLKKAELIESVPSTDRDFYASQLGNVSSVEEAEERFAQIGKAIQKAKVRQLEEELENAEGKGSSLTETEDWDDVSSLDQVEESQDFISDRMKQFAGIK